MDFSVIFQLRTKKFWWMDVIFYFVIYLLIATVLCYFIFLIVLEIFFYLVTAYYACKIFSLTVLRHFAIFSIFTLIFLIAEIVYVHDLIVYENNYFEQANLICHILNILFMIPTVRSTCFTTF